MRAFRPSHFVRPLPEECEDMEQSRKLNLQKYLERARAGLPLFDTAHSLDQNELLHRLLKKSTA